MDINWPKLMRRKFVAFFPLWWAIEYAVLRLVMLCIDILPISVSTAFMRRIGDIMYLILPARRRIALSNLDRAFGKSKTPAEKKRIALESFRHLAVSFMEFFRLPKFVKIAAANIAVEGQEHINETIERGKGTIIAMSHLGPWEYLGFIVLFNRHPSSIIARAVRNPYVYNWAKFIRRKMGLNYIDKDEGVRGVLTRLRKNEAVAVVIDQWAGNDGIWVDFFGKPTSTTPFPARLAQKTDCTVMPAYCVRLSAGRYKIHAAKPIYYDKNDANWVENTTGKLNNILENSIRLYPEQWTWTHRRWKDKRHVAFKGNF